MLITGALGLASSAIIITPVYGRHLQQILVTMGGLIVAQQLIIVLWGPHQITLPLPTALRGSFVFGDVAVESYRLLAVVIGLVVFAAHAAGAQPHQDRPADPRRRREQRDGRGARLSHPPLFIGVFVAGSALAGLGGVMWGFYRES